MIQANKTETPFDEMAIQLTKIITDSVVVNLREQGYFPASPASVVDERGLYTEFDDSTPPPQYPRGYETAPGGLAEVASIGGTYIQEQMNQDKPDTE